MKSFVITLKNNQYSEQCAARCIKSAAAIGKLGVDKYYGVDTTNVVDEMNKCNLKWTWANNNTEITFCPFTGLRQHPYKTADLRARMGCFMSHFKLWQLCCNIDEPILILEHDAVFITEFTKFDFHGICQINDPTGATPRGALWSSKMKERGAGVHEKTWIRSPQERLIPDGLAGNSAYVIKPWAAYELITLTKKVGVWPNDAIMCKQLLPYLEEYYPFITKVQQKRSTTSI